MSDYVRPALPSRLFYDKAGAVIDYGNRWRGESPPEDTYSVDSNPQRFAPLHAVADALIEHLKRNYAVDVGEDVSFAADLMHGRDDVVRAVRLVSVSADAAPLTFVFTSYPGIVVQAGLLHDFPFPQCGCDACDETAESAADELERLVLAVAAGGYREWLDAGAWLSVGCEIVSADGARRSGSTIQAGIAPARLEAAAERFGRLPGGSWQPWPPAQQ